MGVIAKHIEDIISSFIQSGARTKCLTRPFRRCRWLPVFPALPMVTCFSRAGCAHQRLHFPALIPGCVCDLDFGLVYSDYVSWVSWLELSKSYWRKERKWSKPNKENLPAPKRKFAGWSRTEFVRWRCLYTAVQTNSVWNFQNQICPGFQFCNHYLCKAK